MHLKLPQACPRWNLQELRGTLMKPQSLLRGDNQARPARTDELLVVRALPVLQHIDECRLLVLRARHALHHRAAGPALLPKEPAAQRSAACCAEADVLENATVDIRAA